MNIDEKKIPESTLPEHSQLPSQEQPADEATVALTDEELAQVAGAGARLSILPGCPICGEHHKESQPCPNPNDPTNQK